MTIGKFQDKFMNNKGCMVAMSIVFAFIMSFFIFGSCARNAGMPNGQEENKSVTVLSVGDIPLTEAEVLAGIKQMGQTQMGPPGFTNAAMMAGYALDQQVNSTIQMYVAEKDRVPITDDVLMKAATGEVNQEIGRIKTQLKLKPNASKAETDAAFKKAVGVTESEALAKAQTNLKAAMADKEQRASIESKLIGPILADYFTSSIKPSDAEIKASYDVYVTKRIMITKRPGDDAAAKTKAQEALKAVQGTQSFEAAIDKYSSEPPKTKNGKKSDSTTEFMASRDQSSEAYKAIAGQKAGFISPIVEEPFDDAIYKVISVRNDLPKDFDKNKLVYQKMYAQNLSGPKLQEEIKQAKSPSNLKWTSASYKALWDYQEAQMGQMMDPTKKTDSMNSVIEEAKAAVNKGGENTQPALYAWFNAEESLYQQAGANKDALKAGRIEVLKAVLNASEDSGLRMELVDLYIANKDGQDALANLVQASRDNSATDEMGLRTFGDIAAKADSLVKSKLVKEDDLKELNETQAAWKKNKKDSDDLAAQTKADEEAQRKNDAENEKKNKEELAKQKAAAPAPGSTKPGAASAPTAPPTGATAGATSTTGAATAGAATKPATSGSSVLPPGASPKPTTAGP